MTSLLARVAGVAVGAVLLLAATECWAQTLMVFPDARKHSVPFGKSLVLTCLVEAPDEALVTLPQWMNPDGLIINRKIPALERNSVYSEPGPDKQSRVLYISRATAAMAGNYTCTAAYANMPLSDTIYIKTFSGIDWLNANADQFAIKGRDFKVMCEVTAKPAPSVNWFKNGIAVVTSGKYIIQTNGLLIKDVDYPDAGVYTCRAMVLQTGELSLVDIVVEVYTLPAIGQQEFEVEVREGSTFQLQCNATADPAPKFTWIKLSTKEDLAKTSRFSVNEFSGILNFDRVEAGDYGKYLCVATNRAGTAEAEFQVEVLVPPKIYQLLNTTAPMKTEGHLICKATGRPAPYIAFRKQGDTVTFVNGQNNNSRIHIVQNVTQSGDQMSTTAIMTIQDLLRTDDGLYECIAHNKGGLAKKQGLVTVQFKPVLMSQDHVWTWNSQPVNISCLAESIPNATLKWKRFDQDLVESYQVRIYGSGPFSYVTIIPTDPTLYGYYKCIATNALGEAEHTIQVRQASIPGTITQVLQETITSTTISFSITGPAEDMGPPLLAYTAQFKAQGNIDWNYSQNRTWSINSPYIIENLMPMLTYNFRFAAVNRVGAGPWSAPMLIRMPKRSAPEAPKWREAISADTIMRAKLSDSYELQWKVPAHNGEHIIKYEITVCPVLKVSGEWRVTKNSDCHTDEVKDDNAISHEVTGLRPDTRYRMELRAYNILGSSPPAQLFVQTAIGAETTRTTVIASKRLLPAGAIIGLAVAGIFLCLFSVDLLLFCIKRTGVMASLCYREANTENEEEEPKDRDEKEPLQELGEGLLRRNSSVEFDGQYTYASTSGPIIGMNSAV